MMFLCNILQLKRVCFRLGLHMLKEKPCILADNYILKVLDTGQKVCLPPLAVTAPYPRTSPPSCQKPTPASISWFYLTTRKRSVSLKKSFPGTQVLVWLLVTSCFTPYMVLTAPVTPFYTFNQKTPLPPPLSPQELLQEKLTIAISNAEGFGLE